MSRTDWGMASDGQRRTGPPSAATQVVGVIGHPVGHSLSPLLHNTAFAELGVDWVSVGFPVAPGQAATAVAGARALGIRELYVKNDAFKMTCDFIEKRC